MKKKEVLYNELMPGDILLEINPKDDFAQTAAAYNSGHAQIFTGEPLTPTVHAVASGNFPATKASRLDEGADYVIIRCKNREIAIKACELAKRWADYQLPYDTKRQKQIADYQEAVQMGVIDRKIPREFRLLVSTKEITENSHKLFLEKGIYHIIKYASRRDISPMLPDELGGKRGFRCSMFVCLCFQIAFLSDLIKSNPLILPHTTRH